MRVRSIVPIGPLLISMVGKPAGVTSATKLPRTSYNRSLYVNASGSGSNPVPFTSTLPVFNRGVAVRPNSDDGGVPNVVVELMVAVGARLPGLVMTVNCTGSAYPG